MNKRWKEYIGETLDDSYPGTKIIWDGDNLTLIVPDELSGKEHEIVEYAEAIWAIYGGEVVFDLEKATYVEE